MFQDHIVINFYPVNRQLRHQNLTVDGVGVLTGSQRNCTVLQRGSRRGLSNHEHYDCRHLGYQY
jgi:hypothetical protein